MRPYETRHRDRDDSRVSRDRNIRGNIKYKYFGVVNVDGIDERGALLLAEPSIQRQIEALADFVQIALA